MLVATCEVQLPPAPVQPIQQARRMVSVSGTLADGSQELEVASTGPICLRADMRSKVQVQVQEVLANGRTSPPCPIEFVPFEHVEALAADPSAFAVKVTQVEAVPDAPATPDAPAAPAPEQPAA